MKNSLQCRKNHLNQRPEQKVMSEILKIGKLLFFFLVEGNGQLYQTSIFELVRRWITNFDLNILVRVSSSLYNAARVSSIRVREKKLCPIYYFILKEDYLLHQTCVTIEPMLEDFSWLLMWIKWLGIQEFFTMPQESSYSETGVKSYVRNTKEWEITFFS